MPDRSWVVKKNATLQMCWLLNSRAAGELNATTRVILGPQFGTVLGSLVNLTGQDGHGMWDAYEGSPDLFGDISTYAKSKATVGNFLRNFRTLYGNPVTCRKCINPKFTWLNDASDNQLGATGFDQVYFAGEGPIINGSDNQFPDEIQGWQLRALSQPPVAAADGNFSVNYTRHGKQGSTRGSAAASRAMFQLNTSSVSTPDDIPYNSTFWFNNTLFKVPAPFLDLSGNCSRWSPTFALGECICYKGQPLMEDFRANKFCTGADIYVWGFSSTVLLTALILEAVWSLVFLLFWMVISVKSTLVPFTNSGVGTIRNLLDLSDAIDKDLGGNTSWYSDSHLRRELRKRHPVGYEVQDKGDGVKHLALVPLPQARRTVDRAITFESIKRYV
ncbi:hypothetical protein QBC47DRAFT_377559 [Echria macrotheca]|uniref:Uncharacterized protein n=1 Tax=Echria macrotheca TaxID=438768 RepID=A0AAJ0FD30_9PEZI|nr:hypothetical protein QBC47DRAFT_377559 [Echria macrotheca]